MDRDRGVTVARTLITPVTTRSELIDAGSLLDVTRIARDHQIKLPCAISAAAWHACGSAVEDTRNGQHIVELELTVGPGDDGELKLDDVLPVAGVFDGEAEGGAGEGDLGGVDGLGAGGSKDPACELVAAGGRERVGAPTAGVPGGGADGAGEL